VPGTSTSCPCSQAGHGVLHLGFVQNCHTPLTIECYDAPYLATDGVPMAEASLSLKRVVEELILEQISAFKQSSELSAEEPLEYHLRHYQIMELYHQLDDANVPDTPPKGWLHDARIQNVWAR
jgi:hypothetical protein